MKQSIELGPIRPPSEAESILLRITRNCPWNKCAFCPVYKGKKFSKRPVEDIKKDIDIISSIINEIKNKSGQQGQINDIDEDSIQKVMYWNNFGLKNLFLQDGDSLVFKTKILEEILIYIREKIPSIERITSYSRAKTLCGKSVEELKKLKSAGLNRIHIGLESGSDNVLELIKKGVTAEEHISGGQKAVEAGFEVSEYFMPGAGGAEFSEENAIESARVLNRINPNFIRLRSTVPIPRTPLYEMMQEGKWSPVSEEGKVKEIRLFIENLDGITSSIHSDHIMNLIEDVRGKFPEDKNKILDILDKFLNMNINDREEYIIGRRTGHFRYLSDFKKIGEISQLRETLKSQFDTIDQAVENILRSYI